MIRIDELMPPLLAALSIGMVAVMALGLLRRGIRLVLDGEMAEPDTLPGEFPVSPLSLREVLLVAAMALAVRVGVALLGYLMYRLNGGTEDLLASFEGIWLHWDARHYLGIARQWYTDMGNDRLRLVFFPFYPMLMRGLSRLTGLDPFAAGTLLSWCFSAGAAVALYDLVKSLRDRNPAWAAVGLFLLCPFSIFMGLVYTEALFLFLTLLCMCLLMRGHPWAAALCGMLGAFTRTPGVIVAGLFLVRLLREICGRRRPRVMAAFLAQALMVFAGLAMYWLINVLVTGAPFTYLTYQRENWHQEAGTFWNSVENTVNYFMDTAGETDHWFLWGAQLVVILLTLLLMMFRLPHLPFDLAAWSLVYALVVISPTWLLSAPRYLYAMATWPLMLGDVLGTGKRYTAAIVLFSLLLAVWVYGYMIVIEVY